MTVMEVEVRSFITKEQYDTLKSFFEKNATDIEHNYQETFYFDTKEDLRIQKNDRYAKVWLKKGQMHDDAREEIEVHFAKEDFDKLEQLFSALQFNVGIKWFRTRMQCRYDNSIFCLDYTKGYGYILEIERVCKAHEQETALETIKAQLAELNINQTPKEEFRRRFEEYKANWKELTKE